MKGSSPEIQLAGFLAKYTTAFFFYGTTGILSSDEEYDGSLLRISRRRLANGLAAAGASVAVTYASDRTPQRRPPAKVPRYANFYVAFGTFVGI
jgi:hypothetical protein